MHDHPSVEQAPRPTLLAGWRFRLLELGLLARLAQIALQLYPRRRDAWRAVWRQISVHREYAQLCHLTKAVRVGKRVFTQVSFPWVDSPAARSLAESELLRRLPLPGRAPGLNKVFLAMTKKCSLQCAHCFEWDALNGRETLTAQAILDIIRKLQAGGLATLELSGGEPLNRFDELLRILRESDTRQTDFWVDTSGYRLSAERAQALAKAGLTGIAVSLDHWDPAAHDRFRGLPGSFDWACQAVHNAREAGLAVCLTLTALREFCRPGHLWAYARLARDWGAHLIRILEPQPVGHFSGRDVRLRPLEMAVLEEFVRKIQRERRYRDFPIVEYYAPHQRQAGCSGAGKRFLYIDTDGEMHACPFCRKGCGSAVQGSIAEGIQRMAEAGACPVYPSA